MAPDEKLLTQDDWVYLRTFEDNWSPQLPGPRQFQSRLAWQWIPLYNVGQSHSSTLFRLAVLVFMSYQQNNAGDQKTWKYLDKFYKEAKNSIQVGSIVDIVYGSYIIAVTSLVAGESLKPVFVHCLQFCRSAATFAKSSNVRREELSWIEMLWQEIISSLYDIHRNILFRGIGGRASLEESFEYLSLMLIESRFFLPSDQEIEEISMTTELICQKLQTLSIYMQLYFEYYLFVKGRRETEADKLAEVIATELLGILDKIFPLISHLPNILAYINQAYDSIGLDPIDGPVNDFLHYQNIYPRGLKDLADPKVCDTALAMLYTFARLIQSLLRPAADFLQDVTSDTSSSAIALCRLCTSFPNHSFKTAMVSLLVKRTLFWAGLILTKSRFPTGTHILLCLFNDCRTIMDYRKIEKMHSVRI
jgi:hypothetical protein